MYWFSPKYIVSFTNHINFPTIFFFPSIAEVTLGMVMRVLFLILTELRGFKELSCFNMMMRIRFSIEYIQGIEDPWNVIRKFYFSFIFLLFFLGLCWRTFFFFVIEIIDVRLVKLDKIIFDKIEISFTSSPSNQL